MTRSTDGSSILEYCEHRGNGTVVRIETMSKTRTRGASCITPWYLTILCFQVQLILNIICALPLGEPEGVVTTIADVQRIAEAKLDNMIKGYIGSGAGEEQTLRENMNAFKRLRFRPRILVDVSKPNTNTTILGETIAFPIGFSPSAAHRIADNEGEKATAQAAQEAGTLMILSAMSSTTLEDVRASAPGLVLWQQLYIFRNRSLTESLVRRAEEQGFSAIVLTVDSPVAAQTSIVTKSQFRLPENVSLANLEASFPGHSFNFDPSSGDYLGNYHTATVTWDDVAWLRGITRLPIVAKGILTSEAAIAAVDHGAAAIIVSNHGGRILDGTPATIEALPEIVAAVGNRTEVYMDGGIRFGSDVAKALSVGARAVFVGRPALWGLAYNGKKGVQKVLSILQDEFVQTMQLLGCPNSNYLNHDYVVREEHYGKF
uniref:(S)-2-hydroxy-acid oxidase n=1 Tax=Rhipicephalus pulchellus TaxID=72859 RepID=L7LZW4_RHIPC